MMHRMQYCNAIRDPLSVYEQVYSFCNVCIEELQVPVTRMVNRHGRKVYFYETAKVVVYNSANIDGLKHLSVSGSANTRWNHWDIHFRRGHFPLSHTFHNSTAFFLAQTCPANLHHFWFDEFVQLYSVVNRVNRLHPGCSNQLFYRDPPDVEGTDIANCRDNTVYEDFLRTLFINPFHDVFYRAPVNECYGSAVFGIRSLGDDHRTIIQHVTTNLLGKETLDEIESSKLYVTFVQRRYRRIVNMEELMQTARNVGFENVRIVYFEQHSIKEQVKLTLLFEFSVICNVFYVVVAFS